LPILRQATSASVCRSDPRPSGRCSWDSGDHSPAERPECERHGNNSATATDASGGRRDQHFPALLSLRRET
jgi:hypothetical protein